MTRLPLAVVVAGALIAGCGSSTSSSTPVSVTIKSFMFRPNPLNARVGQTLSVSNGDTTPHTFTADDHGFDSGTIAAGGVQRVTLTRPGTVSYHCSIHNFMTGVIHVSA